jgi:phenylpropionate dioxygenase-like ring-hydroxylating dioxygenase large terminal subunit
MRDAYQHRTKETRMTISHEDIAGWVSVERGEIDRRIYSDDEIFEVEMEQIFGRAWLFLCHESQIPEQGDFFQSVMGRDNVLVVRQKDGSVSAMLNTCAHRGNAVCRADEGNARSFLCTYHGWSYGIDGKLKGVPGFKNFYDGELDKSEHSLPAVAQVASYKGFVFGTHDVTAPPLEEYLGPTGRLGIDLLACKGNGIEAVPGIQKFVLDCNWKFAVDNLFDWYHPQFTHASAFGPDVRGSISGPVPDPPAINYNLIDMSGVEHQDGEAVELASGAISNTTFDNVVVVGEYGHAIGGPTAQSRGNEEFPPGWRMAPGVAEALGPVGINVAGHPNIFPTSWITTTMQLSLRIPRSASQTEVWWFSFVPCGLPPEIRQMAVRVQNHVFGPAGILEQEDGENWNQSTVQTRGLASRRTKHLLNMGLGRGKVIKEHGLAHIDSLTNEHAQLWTYHSWAQWMKGLDWPELRDSTTPPDVL